MTGPEHYHRAEQLLAEANEIIRFRQQPGQSGPADLPARPTDMEERRRLSSDPGLPDRTIAEAQVHATLALAAATAVALARTAGRGPTLPEPSSAADSPRRRTVTRWPGSRRMAPDHNPSAADAAARRWRHARPVVTSIADRPSLHCAMSGLPGRQGEQSLGSGHGARLQHGALLTISRPSLTRPISRDHRA